MELSELSPPSGLGWDERKQNLESQNSKRWAEHARRRGQREEGRRRSVAIKMSKEKATTRLGLEYGSVDSNALGFLKSEPTTTMTTGNRTHQSVKGSKQHVMA